MSLAFEQLILEGYLKGKVGSAPMSATTCRNNCCKRVSVPKKSRLVARVPETLTARRSLHHSAPASATSNPGIFGLFKSISLLWTPSTQSVDQSQKPGMAKSAAAEPGVLTLPGVTIVRNNRPRIFGCQGCAEPEQYSSLNLLSTVLI